MQTSLLCVGSHFGEWEVAMKSQTRELFDSILIRLLKKITQTTPQHMILKASHSCSKAGIAHMPVSPDSLLCNFLTKGSKTSTWCSAHTMLTSKLLDPTVWSNSEWCSLKRFRRSRLLSHCIARPSRSTAGMTTVGLGLGCKQTDQKDCEEERGGFPQRCHKSRTLTKFQANFPQSYSVFGKGFQLKIVTGDAGDTKPLCVQYSYITIQGFARALLKVYFFVQQIPYITRTKKFQLQLFSNLDMQYACPCNSDLICFW